MDIPRGNVNVNLDNISQPPSREQTGNVSHGVPLSEVEVIYPTTPITMAVMSSDAPSNQVRNVCRMKIFM